MRKIIPAVAMTLALAVPAFAQAAEACCCCKQDPANAHAGHDAHGADPDHAAHGVVTTPANGAMTDGSPDWFTATLSADGRPAITVPVAAAAATTRVSADLPTLAPGNYVLNWTAEGADGHEMTGVVRFMVH